MSNLTRRQFLQTLAGGAAGLAAMGARPGVSQQVGRRGPNVILIMVDDLSARELGCYGHPEHRTPVLDRLAETGRQFRTCWATPICSPSRAAIMTGRYGFRTGWFHNELKTSQPLCEENLTFAQVMKSAGYATAVTGKWQLPGLEKDYGFDEAFMWLSGHPLAKKLRDQFDGPVEQKGHSLPGRTARYWHPAIVRNGELIETTDEDYGPDLFVDFIEDFVTRHRDQAFFLYYPMCLTHVSWDFERNRSGYLPPPALDQSRRRAPGRGEPTLRANVEYTDYLAGRIVAHLDSLGLRQNTVLMFTCDNGTAGYGKGRIRQEKGPRVPMIVNAPGLVEPVGPCDELIDFSDVLPTIADLGCAALPGDYVIDGRSFAPLLRGESYRRRDWIFSYYAVHRMLRDGRWLLDGAGHLYDCGDNRDESGYTDVTESADPEAVRVREHFQGILQDLPAPPDEARRLWEEKQAQKRNRRRKGQTEE